MAGERVPEIEMIVESVRVHMRTGRHVLLLKEVGAGRILPVWIGPWEAQAIAMRLQGIAAERPLTHDLFATTLGELGVRVDRVVIASLADETFHARLVLVTADSRHELDARPSDAIALAVRLECPIYAAAAVLDQAAALPDGEDEEDEADSNDEEGSAAREEARDARRSRLAAGSLEATGESLDPTKLDIFREFVNSLDLEGGDPRSGGGTSGQS
jgi:bifunctional DNase/RNase